MEFMTGLLLIVGIDLILAGDNAIVIALAARKLPPSQQKKAIFWGTVAAVGIRIAATLAVVWLLNLPGLHLVGGILLLWIAYKLLVDHKGNSDVKAQQTLSDAIRTIVVADALMGLDNVLAVAGAANENYLLVILGLLISIPIIMWGSTLFIKVVERFPFTIYAGAAVLAFTAAKMVSNEPFLTVYFAEYPIVKWAMIAVVIAAVLLLGKRKNKSLKHEDQKPHSA